MRMSLKSRGSQSQTVPSFEVGKYKLAVAALCLAMFTASAHSQIQSEAPLPTKQKKEDRKKDKQQQADLEWMWQYSPPPAEGREHELIQDGHYHDFLTKYFSAPQSFWGSTTLDPRNTRRKTLADTVDDFLTVPGKVLADENRYLTITGHVFRYPAGRGLVFADLNTKTPLVVFAAIDWIRESHPTTEPEAEYTLWIFPNQLTQTMPPPLIRSLTRWMAEPLPGSGIVQKITAAIIVDPDGTPHQIPVPSLAPAAAPEEGRQLPKRKN